MANALKMAEVYTVYPLLERGWSRRRIARTLQIDRETVRRYARLAREELDRRPSLPAGVFEFFLPDDIGIYAAA